MGVHVAGEDTTIELKAYTTITPPSHHHPPPLSTLPLCPMLCLVFQGVRVCGNQADGIFGTGRATFTFTEALGPLTLTLPLIIILILIS